MRITQADALLRRACTLTAAAFLGLAPSALAQRGAPPTIVHDASALRPPPGHRVAIIEFYDLQCPLCAETNPSLIAAAAQYKLPWIRYDLLNPGHNWSRQAAIDARFFDTRSASLGNGYRDYIFAHQLSIETPADLQQFTQRFAQAHSVALPFVIDPAGKFATEIQTDMDLGRRIGIGHTPTIFIVASAGHAPPYTEVTDPSRLFQTIDRVLAEANR